MIVSRQLICVLRDSSNFTRGILLTPAVKPCYSRANSHGIFIANMIRMHNMVAGFVQKIIKNFKTSFLLSKILIMALSNCPFFAKSL